MPIRLRISSSDAPKPVPMDVEPDDLIGEMKESVAEYWGKDPSVHVIKKGVTVFSDDTKISDADIQNDDVLTLVHLDELTQGSSEADTEEIRIARDWLFDNIGIQPDNLLLLNEYNEGGNHIIIFQDETDNNKYQLVYDQDNQLKEYRPL